MIVELFAPTHPSATLTATTRRHLQQIATNEAATDAAANNYNNNDSNNNSNDYVLLSCPPEPNCLGAALGRERATDTRRSPRQARSRPGNWQTRASAWKQVEGARRRRPLVSPSPASGHSQSGAGELAGRGEANNSTTPSDALNPRPLRAPRQTQTLVAAAQFRKLASHPPPPLSAYELARSDEETAAGSRPASQPPDTPGALFSPP